MSILKSELMRTYDASKVTAEGIMDIAEIVDRTVKRALRERPKGKWKRKLGTLCCSVCGNSWSVSFEHLLNNFNYCPNCGADMRSKIVGKHADFMMIDEAVAKGADDE